MSASTDAYLQESERLFLDASAGFPIALAGLRRAISGGMPDSIRRCSIMERWNCTSSSARSPRCRAGQTRQPAEPVYRLRLLEHHGSKRINDLILAATDAANWTLRQRICFCPRGVSL